jgi:hypothetical protein
MAIPPDRQHKAFKDEYMQKITWEVPQSGALEYIEGFLIFSQTHNINKARRLMQKAKKRATAAKDTGMLQQIELAEQMLSISPGDIMNMLAGMDERMFEELLEEIGGFDDGEFF